MTARARAHVAYAHASGVLCVHAQEEERRLVPAAAELGACMPRRRHGEAEVRVARHTCMLAAERTVLTPVALGKRVRSAERKAESSKSSMLPAMMKRTCTAT